MVPGGPRSRDCRAGHTLGRRAGRVSPCRSEIQVERFFGKSLFLGPCLSALDFRHRVPHTHGGPGGVKAILHCGPRGLAGLHGWLQKHAKTTVHMMGKLIKSRVICFPQVSIFSIGFL